MTDMISKQTKTKIRLSVPVLLVFFFLILFSGFIVLNSLFNNSPVPIGQITATQKKYLPTSCVSKIKELYVRGTSMQPLLKNGQKIALYCDYYDCHPFQYNDIIVYQYSQKRTPIVKTIKGLPKDNFYLKQQGHCWNLFVNNRLVKNSVGIPYCLNQQGYKMLSLYVRNYNNTIPENALLILGDDPNGSFDSTMIGLVSKNHILGRVFTSISS